MKKLKTILCDIMAVAVAFSLSACSTAQNGETTADKTTVQESNAEASTQSAEAEQNSVDEDIQKVVYFVETYKDEFIRGFETMSKSSGTVDMWALGTTIVLEYSDESLTSMDEKQFEEFADAVGGPDSILGAFRVAEPAVAALQVDLYDTEHRLLFSKTYA